MTIDRTLGTAQDEEARDIRTTPRLTQMLMAIGAELVRSFDQKSDLHGTSTVRDHAVEVPTSVKNGIEALLQDVEEGREKDPAPRLAFLLSGVKPKKAMPQFDHLPNGAAVVAAMTAVALGSGPDGSITGTGKRQTWANQLANQKVQPLSVFSPNSLNDPSDAQSIQAILTNALDAGCAVKAAGSGHSYSDVATTPDFFIDTHGLNRVASHQNPIAGQLSGPVLRSPLTLALDPVSWPTYDPENNHALIEVEAGITIRALNSALEAWNLGLMNMGGYDGQTLIGAASTSTHGSGVGIGPFPDIIRSLVLATTGPWNEHITRGQNPQGRVYYYRIEPSNGITDPTKYDDPVITLIQDDDCFNAVICSMGCFGIIYSVVIEVMQMYWIEETRSLTTLAQVMRDLAPNQRNPGHLPDVLMNTRNYEVLIHPYPMNLLNLVPMDPTKDPEGYYPFFVCLVTKRNIVPPPAEVSPNRINMPGFLATLLNLVLDANPELTPDAISLSLLTQIDKNYVNKSYEVYNLGLSGGFGFAAEIGFSLDDTDGNYTSANFKAAIDRIHMIAQASREQGEQYQTSAFSLRFVKESRAHLSMMQGRNTAMIEMDMLTGTYGGAEIMYRYETSMYPLGGRPHWGLEFNFLSGNNGLLHSMYPMLDRWLAVYKQFNGIGTFNNSFTQRMGFTVLSDGAAAKRAAPPV